MRGLYDRIENWQDTNQKRFLSHCIHQDGGRFCCNALTNPMEVVITSEDGERHAEVCGSGQLMVFELCPVVG